MFQFKGGETKVEMASLSKTYTNLVAGYCRINANNLTLFVHLQRLILKYYKIANRSRRIICQNRLYSLYMEKKYRIQKYFTLSNFNTCLLFKLIVNLKIKLFIKVIPSISKYEGHYQSGTLPTQKFNCNLNLLQLTQNYPTNTTKIRGKAILEGDEKGKIHLLQIHFYTEQLIHLGHLSMKLKGQDINHGILHLEWETLQMNTEDYKGGYLKVDTNPDQLMQDEYLPNWDLYE